MQLKYVNVDIFVNRYCIKHLHSIIYLIIFLFLLYIEMWLNVIYAELKSSQYWSVVFTDHAPPFDIRVFAELQMMCTRSGRSCNFELQIVHLCSSLPLPLPPPLLTGFGEYIEVGKYLP